MNIPKDKNYMIISKVGIWQSSKDPCWRSLSRLPKTLFFIVIEVLDVFRDGKYTFLLGSILCFWGPEVVLSQQIHWRSHLLVGAFCSSIHKGSNWQVRAEATHFWSTRSFRCQGVGLSWTPRGISDPSHPLQSSSILAWLLLLWWTPWPEAYWLQLTTKGSQSRNSRVEAGTGAEAVE